MATPASSSLITVTAKPTRQFSPDPDSGARQLRHEPVMQAPGFELFLPLPVGAGQAQDGQSQAELHPPQDQFLHEGF
jgi:hypothetical protein